MTDTNTSANQPLDALALRTGQDQWTAAEAARMRAEVAAWRARRDAARTTTTND